MINIIQNNINVNDLVSIIIPVYNVEKYLDKCLESIVNQSYTNIEILCIDNNSSDSSLSILQAWAGKDSRIKVLNCKIQGLSATRNTGLKVALGKYVVFVDSDDYVELSYIEDLYCKLIDDNADLVVAINYNLDNATSEVIEDNNYYYGMLYIKNNPAMASIYENNVLLATLLKSYDSLYPVAMACNKIYKMSVIKEHNIEFPVGLKHEDELFFIRYLLKINNLSILWKSLYYYRTNRPDSIIMRGPAFLDYLQIFSMIFDEINVEISKNTKQYESMGDVGYGYDNLLYSYINNFIDRIDTYYVNKRITTEEIELLKRICEKLLLNSGYKKVKPKRYERLIKFSHGRVNDLVSIIIPVYNVEKYLDKCLESIVNQSYTNIEILCIDNNSSDGSLSILQAWAGKDSRIKVLNCKIQGASASRNVGLKVALGKYVTYVDSDDYVELSYIEDLYRKLIDDNADLVVATNYNLDNATSELIDDDNHYYGMLYIKNNPAMASIYENNVLLATLLKSYDSLYPIAMGCNKIYKMSVIKEHNIEFPVGLKHEDELFFIRYLLKINNLSILWKSSYYYRTNRPDSVSMIGPAFLDYLQILSMIFDEINVEISKNTKQYESMGDVGYGYDNLLYSYINNFIYRIDTYYVNKPITTEEIELLKKICEKLLLLNSGYKKVNPKRYESLIKFSHGRLNYLVSIIIPVYNVEKYLDRCLESIVNQSYTNIEILCIDNNSSDNSLSILQAWAGKDSRIKVLNCKIQGPSATRNMGLKVALGKYVVFVDSDDYVGLSYVQTLYDLSENHDVDLAIMGISLMDEQDNYIEDEWYALKNLKSGYVNMDYIMENMRYLPFASFAKIFKTQVIKENNLCYDENLIIGEDIIFNFTYMLSINNVKIYCHKQNDLYYYGTHSQSITNSGVHYYSVFNMLLAFQKLLQQYDCYDKFYNHYIEHVYNQISYYLRLSEKNVLSYWKEMDLFFSRANISDPILEELRASAKRVTKISHTNITLLCVYHRPFILLQNNHLKPILVNANNQSEEILQLFSYCLKDNFGDNISAKNQTYCELTALYTLYKNKQLQEQSQYLGLMHYRRIFKTPVISDVLDASFDVNGYTQSLIGDLVINDIDLLIPSPWLLNTTTNMQTNYALEHFAQDFDTMLAVLKEYYPDVYKSALMSIKESKIHPFNMFLAKTPLFNQICEFIFDVLFKVEALSNWQDDEYVKDAYQIRVAGFLSERLMSIYFDYLNGLNQYKIAHNDVIVSNVYDQNTINDTAINIFTTANNNYAQHLAVMMASVLKNANAEDNIIFHIFEDRISVKNKKKIAKLKHIKAFDVSYHQLQANFKKDIDKLTKICNMPPHIHLNTYSRLFIPKYFPFLKKAIWLDADVIVNQSLSELMNINIGDKAIGAVQEVWNANENFKANLKMSPTSMYFNAGVLLMNIPKMAQKDIVKEFLDIATTEDIIVSLADQDVLNKVFEDDVYKIPLKFNMQKSIFLPYLDYVVNVYPPQNFERAKKYYAQEGIVHYTSSDKPWSRLDKFRNKNIPNLYWHYIKYTKYKGRRYEFLLQNMKHAYITKIYKHKIHNRSLRAHIEKNLKLIYMFPNLIKTYYVYIRCIFGGK